ncbi:MAG: hypothetical protein L0Z68_03520 [Gammaproteobacteria bacterium]|nr:hypothetical protein [Gammaproteobacteria bacterium]
MSGVCRLCVFAKGVFQRLDGAFFGHSLSGCRRRPVQRSGDALDVFLGGGVLVVLAVRDPVQYGAVLRVLGVLFLTWAALSGVLIWTSNLPVFSIGIPYLESSLIRCPLSIERKADEP